MKPVYIQIDEEGNKFYYKDKEMKILHREDGPAYEWLDGNKAWYFNDKRHREDGPAVEWADGDKEWWLNDVQYSEEEFKKRTSKRRERTVKDAKSASRLEQETERVCRLAEQRGEFVSDVDGFVYWVPSSALVLAGQLSSYQLRILAHELDRRNAAWQEKIDEEFSSVYSQDTAPDLEVW